MVLSQSGGLLLNLMCQNPLYMTTYLGKFCLGQWVVLQDTDDEEEEELVRWLIGCAEVGYAKSIQEVRAIVGAIVAKKLKVDHATVSHGWWDRFRQRHPNLTLRTGESLSYVRAASTNRVVIDKYFDLLEDILSKNSLTSSRIFNLDESGIPLQHRPGKRIAVRGQKHVNVVVTSGNKMNITVLACVSASGLSCHQW